MSFKEDTDKVCREECHTPGHWWVKARWLPCNGHMLFQHDGRHWMRGNLSAKKCGLQKLRFLANFRWPMKLLPGEMVACKVIQASSYELTHWRLLPGAEFMVVQSATNMAAASYLQEKGKREWRGCLRPEAFSGSFWWKGHLASMYLFGINYPSIWIWCWVSGAVAVSDFKLCLLACV